MNVYGKCWSRRQLESNIYSHCFPFSFFLFCVTIKNKKKVQNHVFPKTGIKEENESDPQIKVIIPISFQSGKLKLGRKYSLLCKKKSTGYPVCMNLDVS